VNRIERGGKVRELRVEVERVEGTCTGPVPMVPGVAFHIRDGRLFFPRGGPICLFALQSILPLLPAKERGIEGGFASHRLERVRHVQCPDPDGRVIWRIDQHPIEGECVDTSELPSREPGDLLIEVERIEGRCTAGMRINDRVLVRESSLYLSQPFCLYAMQAIIPLLPAKERAHDPNDWMLRENRIICPDPTGNVIFRIREVT
jgi:uncharacterized repeat protein (TIGR04076 family)